MPDRLVRDIDSEVCGPMKTTVAAQRKSLWAEIDRFRDRIGPLQSNSTANIRAARDRAAHRR